MKSVAANPAAGAVEGADRIRTGVRCFTARTTNQSRPTTLYFIQEGHEGAIKVGIAADLTSRLRGLQSGNPRELHVLAWFPEVPAGIEPHLHSLLLAHRLVGEWFAPHADVYTAIAACAEAFRQGTCDECERGDRYVALGHDRPVDVAQPHSCGFRFLPFLPVAA